MIRLALFAFLMLSSCGADGAPTPPKAPPATPASGVTISGTTSFGVVSN